MTDIGEGLTREAHTPSYDEVAYVLVPFFAERPDADWAALGLASRRIMFSGVGSELPDDKKLRELEIEADELLGVYERSFETGEVSPDILAS